MSWKCPKCGYPNPDSRTVCFKCGSTQSLIVYQTAPLSASERNIWITNIGLHRMPSQIDRQRRAAEVPLLPSFVDDQAHVARIWDYCVTLESCSCQDFEKRGKPCKHMYRLAHELGVITLDITPVTVRPPSLPSGLTAKQAHRQNLLVIGGMILFVIFILLVFGK